MDRFVDVGREQPARLQRPREPGVREHRTGRRDGVSRRGGDPELLALRARLRAPGRDVRAGRVVEPAGAPLPRVGVVGVVHVDRPVQLHERHRRPVLPADDRARRAHAAPAIDFAWTDLTDLLHARRRQLGVLRRAGNRARLPERRGDLRTRALRRRTPGIWNPLPLFTDVKENGQLGNVQDVGDVPSPRRRPARSPRCRGSPRRRSTASTRRRACTPGRRT